MKLQMIHSRDKRSTYQMNPTYRWIFPTYGQVTGMGGSNCTIRGYFIGMEKRLKLRLPKPSSSTVFITHKRLWVDAISMKRMVRSIPCA